MHRAKYLSIALLIGVISLASTTSVLAEDASDQFNAVWNQTDQLVQAGTVNRSWIWGAGIAGSPVTELYVSAPGGQRTVRYYDKSRMEINNPGATIGDGWSVTNGLLVTEMISGRIQLGDDTFADFAPARINVAGDLDDPAGPTYATFSLVTVSQPTPSGKVISSTIDRGGSIETNARMAQFGVIAETYVPTTDHTVASVFWAFMNETGPIILNNTESSGPLFANPFYATGLPLSEAYWTQVRVGGAVKDVLVQAFERRVLTYTPDNPPGWQVETGNVGLQYFDWRYQQIAALCATKSRPETCNVLNRTTSPTTQTNAASPNQNQSNSSTVQQPVNAERSPNTDVQNGSSSGSFTCSSSDTSSSESTNNTSQNVRQTNTSNIDQSGGSVNCTSVNQTNSSN